jgi:hypothetical protein
VSKLLRNQFMRGFNMARIGLSLLLLAGCALLGTLVDVESTSAQRFRSPALAASRHTVAPPESPEHGYRHFVRGGAELVFDARLSAYAVSDYSDRYFHGKRYLWHHGDRWQISNNFEGPWKDVSEREVPRGLRNHYAQKSNDERPAVPAKKAP